MSRIFNDIKAAIDNKEKTILFIVALLAILINFTLMLTHEPWRDEAQAWLISRDLTPVEMIRQMSYEGHPILWYYILAPFSKLGFPYITLNIVSLIIMSVCVILIAFRAPFGLFTKICIIFSEMCIYQYAVISRSYCLCALLIILLAMHYAKRFEHPIYFGILLALLLQTHILMAGMVFIICIIHFIDVICKYLRDSDCKNNRFVFTNIIGLAIVFLSGIFLLAELRNVGSASDAGRLRMGFDTSAVKLIISGIFTPYRVIEKVLTSNPLATAVLAASAAILLFKKRINKKLIIITLFFVAWQVFINQLYSIMVLQKMILWLFFLLWIVWVSYDADLFGRITDKCFAGLKTNKGFSYAVMALIVFMLSLPFENGIRDFLHKYSDSQDTAEFIEQLPEDAVIYENAGEFCNAVIPYLKTKKIMNPLNGQIVSYCDRNLNNYHRLGSDEFLYMCRKEHPDKNEIYLLFAIDGSLIDNAEEKLPISETVYESAGSVTMERYKIYKIKIR